MHQPDTRTIHLTVGDGPALCSVPTPDAPTITAAEWETETALPAATGARVCRACADEARAIRDASS